MTEDEVEGAYSRDPLLGPSEVAELLRVERDTVYTWKHRGRMCEPDFMISGGPVWRRSRIIAWAKETGRWPDGRGECEDGG